MNNKSPQEIFAELTKGLPKFNDGRVDFTGIKKAPVINIIVKFEDQILILKRSMKVSSYKGLWNGISGFIDELKPIEEFAEQEVREEISLDLDYVKRLEIKQPYIVDDKEIDRIWYVYPTLVELSKKPKIKLDWENDDYKWINPGDLLNYDHVKDLDKSVRAALN